MDSQVPYTATPPSYSSSQPTPYPPQQYPPPSQYPPSQDKQYPPPGTGYPPQPGFGTPQYATVPPPQPEQVVVVSAPAQQAVIVQHVPSFVGHIIFACIVAWCCNWLFGLIAFILASQYSLFTIILNINIEKYLQKFKNHLSPYNLHQLQFISGVDRSISPTLFNMVHELVPTIFELAALPFYKYLLQILMAEHLYFLFQLVSSFNCCPFGLETACFNSTLRCGIRFAKMSSLRNTSKSYAETPFIVEHADFIKRSNVLHIKKRLRQQAEIDNLATPEEWKAELTLGGSLVKQRPH